MSGRPSVRFGLSLVAAVESVTPKNVRQQRLIDRRDRTIVGNSTLDRGGDEEAGLPV
jgi:hypothetical protein